MVQFPVQPVKRTGATGATRRIYRMLRGQMADGALQAGDRMPSTRALAAELGVSRTTITAVYEQLQAEGFLLMSAGRAARVSAPQAAAAPAGRAQPRQGRQPLCLSRFGTRVADMAEPALPTATTSLRFDFRYGAVASRDFPYLAWRRAYQAVLLRQQHSLYYTMPEGEPALQRALQGYLLRARGIRCEAGQILIVQGAQQALDLCARLLLDDGDRFVFENPGYRMARHCFTATGACLLPIPVDAQGLDTWHLPTDGRTRLAYVTPSHQFPLGGVLPIARRQALLRWASGQDAWVIEDDYDGEFRYGQHPIDALQSIDTEGRVIYIGTFSKALSPQIRLGYMVLPQALAPVFGQAKRLTDRHAPMLDQQVLAALIDSGHYERHVRRVRREHERRRAALLQAIAQHLPQDVRVDGAAAGLHMVLWLPGLQSQDTDRLVALARRHAVGVYPIGPLFAPEALRDVPPSAGLILGYASLTPEQIREGIARLAQALAETAGGHCPGDKAGLG